MTVKEKIDSRSKYNEMIFHTVQFIEMESHYSGTESIIRKKLEKNKNLRFGQVVCNTVCSDYRDEKVSEFTKNVMMWLFHDLKMDPFYEEPVDTYNRLCSEAEKTLD